MRILMLAPTFPWPLNRGSKIRIYHTLKELSQSHQVTLVAPLREDDERMGVEDIREFCSKLHTVQASTIPLWIAAARALFSLWPYDVAKFRDQQTAVLMDSLLRSYNYDVVWVHFLHAFSSWPSSLQRKGVVLLDQHNVDEQVWQRFANSGNWLARGFAYQNKWKLRRFQRRVLKEVDVVLSVSQEDACSMNRTVPEDCQVWAVPNGIDTEEFRPSSIRRDKNVNIIILCASMDVFMNVDAAVRFAKELFPLIRTAVPNAEFWIVGRDAESRLRKLTELQGVRVFGTVEDVRPYYEEAKVAVAPYLYGGGTKLKVLESMAMGVPVVGTKAGCQGIQAIGTSPFFVEDTDEGFARRVVELLNEERLRQVASVAGRKLVEQKYSWRDIMTDAISQLESLVDGQK